MEVFRLDTELKGRLLEQGAQLQTLWQHQVHQEARRDFDLLVKEGLEKCSASDIPVTEDFVKRCMVAEAQLDPQLRVAFDQRYRSPQHGKHADKLVEKAMQRLLKSASSQPDPQATADHQLVAAAVRNASSNRPFEAPAVRYGELNDAQFAKEKAKYGL
jgi:hypothetical protein